MVEVREAPLIIAVAEELNFGRAAERLHMSQPPLSAAVKALEKPLGVLLLHRTTRHVGLTSAGSVFLGHCRTVVAAAEAADSAARHAADGQAGEIRIGAVTTLDRPAATGTAGVRTFPSGSRCRYAKWTPTSASS